MILDQNYTNISRGKKVFRHIMFCFQISGFPNVIGCIDGSYIPILTPAHKLRSTYTNRHHQTSMTLQGICDGKKKFWDVFTGVSGRTHDARTFEFSDINPQLEGICEGRYHLLGDGAYPLRPWLLTPYKNLGLLTPEEINFNLKFSSTRVCIENAFGILKMRFRQLYYGVHMHKAKKITKFIICCCVLHNLCIDADDVVPFHNAPIENPNNNVQAPLLDPPRNNALRHQGQLKRDAIKIALL